MLDRVRPGRAILTTDERERVNGAFEAGRNAFCERASVSPAIVHRALAGESIPTRDRDAMLAAAPGGAQ